MNSLLGIFGEAYSEAMLMGRQFGIDTDTIVEAIGGSAMDSPMFQTKNHYGQTVSSPCLCTQTRFQRP